MNIFQNVIYSCDQSCIFSIITPVLSVTWSFRNHSNMLICWSNTFIINGHIYYLHIFVRIIWWITVFEIEIFCNIINVFTVSFDQFYVSLVNKSINLFQKETPNFWMIHTHVYSSNKQIMMIRNTHFKGAQWHTNSNNK